MDHKPDTPEAISALPRKKGSSSQTRSRGCACSLAAVNIVSTVIACIQSRGHCYQSALPSLSIYLARRALEH